MFFLRCVFWLGVVYASMSWPNGTFAPQAREPGTAGALAQAAAGGVAAYCASNAQACLAGAAHLDALIAATARPDGDVRIAPSPASARAGAIIPLPVPDPRRAAHTRF